jgi:hypothetical protein
VSGAGLPGGGGGAAPWREGLLLERCLPLIVQLTCLHAFMHTQLLLLISAYRTPAWQSRLPHPATWPACLPACTAGGWTPPTP